jgi:hypothetical protein
MARKGGTCSWCGKFNWYNPNPLIPTWCVGCGHSADLPMDQCDCPRCDPGVDLHAEMAAPLMSASELLAALADDPRTRARCAVCGGKMPCPWDAATPPPVHPAGRSPRSG